MHRRIVTVKRSLMDLLYIILIGQGMYDRLKYVSPLKIQFVLLVVIYFYYKYNNHRHDYRVFSFESGGD